jgi:putative endonuclease
MPYLYILKSLKMENWHYIGSCHDVNERFKQHQKSSVRSTKSKKPLKLIYTEFYKTISEAKKREYYLKSPKGYLEKKKIIENNT